MAALRTPSYDLALLDAVESAIVATRNVLRATAALRAARLANNPARLRDTARALDNANSAAAAAKSSLLAAVALEAEARA